MAIPNLTPEERYVLDTLAEAWNAYAKLPDKDSADVHEFNVAIHCAQHLIALRVARRVDPDVWALPNATT